MKKLDVQAMVICGVLLSTSACDEGSTPPANDATVSDSAVVLDGGRDASSDASLHQDTQTHDAQPQDGAANDAGASDSSTADTGSGDAGSADAGSDATVAPSLTVNLTLREGAFNSPTATHSNLNCIPDFPEPNYLNSSMDGDMRVLAFRCTVRGSDGRLWQATFSARGFTSGSNYTDGIPSSGPPRLLASVAKINGFRVATGTPDFATRVITQSVDYDARTASGTIDMTMRSASAGAMPFNLQGSFSGNW